MISSDPASVARRLARWASVVCLVALGLVYVSAKIDFFRRYAPDNLSGYVAGHWLYWAAMMLLAGFTVLLARVGGDETEAERNDNGG